MAENEINRLRTELRACEERLSIAVVTENLKSEHLDDRREEVKAREREIESLNEEIREWKGKYDELQVKRGTESLTMIENDHLRADVHRLMQMLRKTEEYKEFASFADEAIGNMHYLKSSKARSKVDLPDTGASRSQRKEYLVDERTLWVPADAVKFAHEFRINYRGELTPVLIEKLLYEVICRRWTVANQPVCS
jgi:antitoxin component HigA of HigAB toxin-antitoxin module